MGGSWSRKAKRAVVVGIVTATLSSLFVIGGGSVAYAEDPIFINWPSLLPSLTDTYSPNSDNTCAAGRSECLDITIREMERRFDPLAQSCNYNAVFSLAYLRTTQTYKWARDQEGYFVDTPFVNHEDAVFAKYYFEAWDNYYSASGNRAAVPKAWQIAFDAADKKKVAGSGSLFLGMSAHVNRDLPFVLAAIGLTFPDGTSRKADHDKVNQFLNAVLSPLMAEEAARFDATIDSARDPLLLGYTTAFQLLAAWRETAWRNAERLVNAPDPASRAQVAQSIEDYAAGIANTLVAAESYNLTTALLGNTARSRDAYCAGHNAAPAPIAYAFGTPSVW